MLLPVAQVTITKTVLTQTATTKKLRTYTNYTNITVPVHIQASYAVAKAAKHNKKQSKLQHLQTVQQERNVQFVSEIPRLASCLDEDTFYVSSLSRTSWPCYSLCRNYSIPPGSGNKK